MSKYALILVLGTALAFGSAADAGDAPTHHRPAAAPSPTDESFDAQLGRSMERMHRDMMVAPSGDPDRDFAAMMIPHHQGAVDMARIQLQFGKDPVLRRLAEGIIVEQLHEIGVMTRALAQLPVPSSQSVVVPSTFTSDHKAH